MNMFSDIATEHTIRSIVKHIAERLETTYDPVAKHELKMIGKFALTLFEWDIPEWVEEYEELFKR